MRHFIIIMSMLMFSSLHYAADLAHLRGKRYCEVIIAPNLTTLSVYNSIGLNDCPQPLWRHISASKIKKDNKAYFVRLNGPRHWMIDGMRESSLVSPDIKNFSGITMREAAKIKVRYSDLLTANKFYTEHRVNRHTTWIYDANQPVFELISPEGKVYVMQSYSIQKKAQSQASLAHLDKQLSLPKGWSFKSGLLKKMDQIIAIEYAVVIQDNFLNTYQLATHDFLS